MICSRYNLLTFYSYAASIFRTGLAVFVVTVIFADTASAQIRSYRGTLGSSKNIIHLTLERTGDSLVGEYMFPKTGERIPIAGSVNDKKVYIREFSPKTEHADFSGAFIGGFKEDKAFNGMWLSRDSAVFFAFALERWPIELGGAVSQKEIILPSHDTMMTGARTPEIVALPDEKTRLKANDNLAKIFSSYRFSKNDESYSFLASSSYTVQYMSDELLSLSGLTDVRHRMNTAEAEMTELVKQYGTVIDLKKGEPVTIRDAFTSKGIRTLSERILKKLHSMKGAYYMKIADCFTQKPTSTNFTVTSYDITFYPNCANSPNEEPVSIPWSELTDLIQPKGVFAVFLLIW